MIKYYAYYNHGGYKDFYLGTQGEDIKSKYFLPLLAVHEQALAENPNDEELTNQVEHQRKLPKLVVLSDNTTDYNYPLQARTLMSHGGYKVMYRNVGQKQYVLVIRDISGPRDVYGRQTPFNIMLVGSDNKDLKDLDIIAEYIHKNLSLFEQKISSIFINDITENGLRCDIGTLRDEINTIIETDSPLMLDEGIDPPVRMLVIPNMSILRNVAKEQNFDKRDILVCFQSDGTTLFRMNSRKSEVSSDVNQGPSDLIYSHIPDSHDDRSSANSVHDMLDVPKRDDIENLWRYVRDLEKRIIELENYICHE